MGKILSLNIDKSLYRFALLAENVKFDMRPLKRVKEVPLS